MTTTLAVNTDRLNGVNVPVMKKLFEDVQRDPRNARTAWGVTTRWVTGAVSETEVTGCNISGKRIDRRFRFRVDEPEQLAGTNNFANPQEYLLGALNACMVVGYVALATHFGIELESVEIQTDGEIDIRGFLGLSKEVKPGYDELHYTVRIKGNGTEAQFREIHEMVIATSPNRFNISQPVKLTSELVVL
jgi:uncharacterized OsmC-like protein